MKILTIKLQLVSLSTISCMLVATCVQASDQAKFHQLLAQLPELPVEEEKEELLDNGIDLLDSLPEEAESLPEPSLKPLSSPAPIIPPSLDAADEGMIESTRDGKLLDESNKIEGMAPQVEPKEIPAPLPPQPLSSPKSILAPTPSDDLSAGFSLPSEPATNPEWSPSVQTPLTAPAESQGQIDFDQMFERQSRQPTDIAMAYESSPAITPYGHGDSYGGNYYTSNRKPSLPPPDSLESMYNGRDCYKDVWAGYAAEKERRGQKYHKHIHGTCECLNKSARYNGPPVLGKHSCGCSSCE
ncbi:hypothetical protein FF011L_46860 [Roseimaritima multifibrata]|uniref:Uncharacterized protein n=1 Tax=Roseimaritima multifibrata TaxID=1930274 RepID=A0A517MLV9_9BACT|nr:hypothetical protein [Roseimaritima multifibrata]QDS95885.1 hypothetical protein FF011L_46860 [Roseimaritima multifibrata]